MESKKPIKTTGKSRRTLFSLEMLWLAWLPMALIGIFHYGTGAHHHWVHDILRRLYYVPILFAAFSLGLRGGLSVAVASSLTYAPHAFLMMPHAQDPATLLNKILEIVLYNTIGILAGVLADRERERREQAERAFAEEQRMGEQLVRAGRLAALGELVAGIAHEIKNPLHTLRGTAEIVDEIIPADRKESAMWKVHRQEIDRIGEIAERFLSFARPVNPALEEKSAPAIYERLRELLNAQVAGHPGVRLSIEPLTPAVAALRCRVDLDQIVQIILNISSNALTALAGSGRLTLRAARRDEHLVLALENDGPIIESGARERIFDPFWTRSDGGTGLGLAIAERLAEEHGGHLEVENIGAERGVGFRLVIPLLTT